MDIGIDLRLAMRWEIQGKGFKDRNMRSSITYDFRDEEISWSVAKFATEKQRKIMRRKLNRDQNG